MLSLTVSIRITDINNTIGLYYEKEKEIKISSDNWKLIVYKDLEYLEIAYENNIQILNALNSVLSKDESNEIIRFRDFALSLKPHRHGNPSKHFQ